MFTIYTGHEMAIQKAVLCRKMAIYQPLHKIECLRLMKGTKWPHMSLYIEQTTEAGLSLYLNLNV